MAGNKLELLLRKTGRQLADYQIAQFWKFPDEMQQTPCDFMGFTASGRVIMIEAKLVHRQSLPIGSAPGLAVHQFNALESCNKAGGLSLVCWARGDVCATLSFDMVVEFSHGRRSVPWHKIEERFLRTMRGDKAPIRLLDQWLPI